MSLSFSLKIIAKSFFNRIMMSRFGQIKIEKGKFCGAKKPLKIWDVNVYNTVILKLVEVKKNSQYLIGYLDEVLKPLVLILPKMNGDIKTFIYKIGDKNKNNKFMSLHVDDGKIFKI